MMSDVSERFSHRNSAPRMHAALMRLRAVTDNDGALGGGFKAVIMAAASAAQRDADLANYELGRAADLGTRRTLVWSTGAIVLSSQGQGAYHRYAAEAERHFGAPPDDAAPASPVADNEALRRAEAFAVGSSDSLPDYARPLRDFAPDALIGYTELIDASWHQPSLSPSEVQLILLCINVATGRPDLAAHHSRLARRAGSSAAQVVEAGVCAIPSGGVAAWYSAGGRLLDE